MSHVSYKPFPNQFRKNLRAGKRLIGCWASLASPITTEILGLAQFDWILLDGEHSPNDVSTLVPQLMALKESTSAPVVRPACNDPVMIKQLLDIGFHNLLLPSVDSADQARRGVAATRYPPEGTRRSFGRTPQQYVWHRAGITFAILTTTLRCWFKSKPAEDWMR